MGLFSNPLSYAGYPPGVTGTPTTQNSTVRAATAAEAATGTATNCYISPATAESATALDFASPPVLGFGSTTPRPVHATTLDSTLNTSLATAAGATTVAIANIAPSGARAGTYHGGNSAQNDIVSWLGGNPSANTQSFSVFGGAPSGGTQTVNFFTGNATNGTQSFNLMTGARAATTNIASSGGAHTVNLGHSTVTSNLLGTVNINASGTASTNIGTGTGVVTIGNTTQTLQLPGEAYIGLGLTVANGDVLFADGDLTLNTAGNKLSIATGANASVGTSLAMNAGSITVSTTAVTASSIIFLTVNTPGGTQGELSAPTASIIAGTSFVINSSSNTDTSTVNWWIVN